MQKHIAKDKALMAKAERVKSGRPAAKTVTKTDTLPRAHDLRTALDWLRGEGDLIETDKEVDPDLEVTGL